MDALEEIGKKMAKEISEGKRELPISFAKLATSVQPISEEDFKEYKRYLIKMSGVPLYYTDVREKINEESK